MRLAGAAAWTSAHLRKGDTGVPIGCGLVQPYSQNPLRFPASPESGSWVVSHIGAFRPGGSVLGSQGSVQGPFSYVPSGEGTGCWNHLLMGKVRFLLGFPADFLSPKATKQPL